MSEVLWQKASDIMAAVLVVYAVIIIFDLQRFIRDKEQARVYIIYIFFMAANLTVSLLIAAGKRPPSPAQWIESAFKIIGVLK